jgi:hypothetical protein
VEFSENNTIAEVGYNLSPEFQYRELWEALNYIIDFFNELK